MKHRYSVSFAVVLAFALLIAHAQAGLAQATGTIEIHKRICPADTVGNVFDECHDNVPDQTVSFSIDGGPSQDVDADGNVIFTPVAAGTRTVTETEGPPLEFVNLRVFCSVQDNDPEVFEVTTDGPSFTVDVGDGDHIVCDVYNIAEDLAGLTPTPTAPTATAAPVAPTSTPQIRLPDTGVGESDGRSVLPILSLMAAGLLMIAVVTALVARRAPRSVGSRIRK